MRKGFDGLSGLVSRELGGEPASGAVFIFINRRGDRIKLLRWEPGGYVLYYKRLERGRFHLPLRAAGSKSLSLGYAELAMLIEGVSIENTKRSGRYLSAKVVE